MSRTLIPLVASTRRPKVRRIDVWRAIAVCGLLVVAVLVVFGRTFGQGFLSYDDRGYICDEPHVWHGLSWSAIGWALSNGPLGEWYPLSMISHMLDCQLYGLNPTGHHVTNVLLHAAVAVVLFLVLWRMTERQDRDTAWPSAVVAALFAVHPLHVESVAWLAERRDMLSGLFFMLTLGAYDAYVRRPSPWRYLAVAGLLALGLSAKPILVTVPALLLLLDYWPLRRFGRFADMTPSDARRVLPSAPPNTGGRGLTHAGALDDDRMRPERASQQPPWRLIAEKLPLLALALAVASVTMLTHSARLADPLSLPERLANAAVSCIAYLGQLFVPVGLSVFYTYPEAGWPIWQVAAAVLLLLTITAATVIGRREHPYGLVGWFWYVGMLVPVLGLTAVGPHARADRYTYLSQIGLYVALVWGAMRLGASWPARRWVFGVGSTVLLLALMICSWRQTGFWQSDLALWGHALSCDAKNVTAHGMIGAALENSDPASAATHYRQALELAPGERNVYYVVRAEALTGLGNLFERNGETAEAVASYEQALQLYANCVLAHLRLGRLLALQGKLADARTHFQRAIELEPSAANYRALAIVDSQDGRRDQAIKDLERALAVDPGSFMAHAHLATLLGENGDVDGACDQFRQAIAIDPEVPLVYYQIAELLRREGNTHEAAAYQRQGQQAGRRYARARNQHGVELVRQGKLSEAIAQYRLALDAAPDDAESHCNMAEVLATQGKKEDAITHYRAALSVDSKYPPAQRGLDRLSER
jgi:tetratricopeptide (TPR) repeat protein